jgi:hypothetical protein
MLPSDSARAVHVSAYHSTSIVPSYIKRLVHLPQMDLEFALYQMVWLCKAPSAVYVPAIPPVQLQFASIACLASFCLYVWYHILQTPFLLAPFVFLRHVTHGCPRACRYKLTRHRKGIAVHFILQSLGRGRCYPSGARCFWRHTSLTRLPISSVPLARS